MEMETSPIALLVEGDPRDARLAREMVVGPV